MLTSQHEGGYVDNGLAGLTGEMLASMEIYTSETAPSIHVNSVTLTYAGPDYKKSHYRW